MLVADALDHFSTKPAGLARLLGISGQAVRKWGEVVPQLSAIRLAQISGFQLRVDAAMYDERGRPRKVGQNIALQPRSEA